MTDPLPDGFAPITPHLVVRGCAEAIAFYKRAFGAEELFSMPTPDGDRLMHAEIKVNGAPIMLADEFPGMGCESPQALGGTAVTLHLYTADIDADYARAVEAGCEAVMPPQDMFWGDRYGRLKDPYGHSWAMATHVRDVSPEELEKAAAKAFAPGPEAS